MHQISEALFLYKEVSEEYKKRYGFEAAILSSIDCVLDSSDYSNEEKLALINEITAEIATLL